MGCLFCGGARCTVAPDAIARRPTDREIGAIIKVRAICFVHQRERPSNGHANGGLDRTRVERRDRIPIAADGDAGRDPKHGA